MLERLWRRLAALFRGGALDRDTDEEIRFHLEMESARLAAEGRAVAEVNGAARRAFGSPLRIREEVREAHGLRWWDDLRNDVRIALRAIRRAPGFHAVFVLTIALGVSLATVIFTAADSIMFRPLPYVDTERTVSVWSEQEGGRAWSMMTVDAWHAWRAVEGPFEAIAAYDHRGADYASADEAVNLAAVAVSPDFFRVVGVPLVLGRSFSRRDFAERHAAIVSHAFWRRRLGGDPAVIGRTISLDGRPTQIIGVLPPDFGFPRRAVEVWLPLEEAGSDTYAVEVVARIKGRRQDAERDLAGLAASLRRDHPEAGVSALSLRPFGNSRLNDDIARGLLVLLVMAVAVLGIAGLNGANLLLFRGLVRKREFATRLALGAGRARLIRQLATEAVVLSLLSAVVALGASAVGVALLRAATPEAFTWSAYHDIALDLRTVALAVGAALAIGLMLSLWPAVAASRQQATIYRAGQLAGGGALARSNRGKKALVAAELAISTALLIGAGLLVRSMWNLNHVDLGLDADHLVSVGLSLTETRYPDQAARAVFGQRLQEGLRALPGVAGFTVADGMAPRTGFGFPDSIEVEGAPVRYASVGAIDQLAADTGYFAVVGTPILAGRQFTGTDYRPGQHPVIVDPDLADRFWPGANPVGRRFRLRPNDPWLTVVGVAHDARLGGADDRGRNYEIYYPADPAAGRRMLFLGVRAERDPLDLVAPIRSLIRRLDPLLPIWHLEPTRAAFEDDLAKPRFLADLVTWLALVGLLLAVLGLYGVVALGVTQRTAEFGLRVALGASSGRIMGMVVRQALGVAAAGVVVGVAVGSSLARFAAPLLYRVSPLDPFIFVAVPVLLGLAALVSALVPARRAARMAPMDSLRVE